MLGRTGIRVSEVGFGCGNIGGLMIRGTHEEQVAAVRRALALGITYFDTAPMYGNGLSETNVGRVFDQLKPQGVTIGTKVNVRPEEMGDARGAVLRSVETSLTRLKTNRLDLLQLHNTLGGPRGTSPQDVSRLGGILDAMESVKAQGLVRFISMTGLGDTDVVHQVVDTGRFDAVQVYYNVLNPSAGNPVPIGFYGQDFKNVINKATRHGMGVFNIRVMAGGALGGPGARTGYAAPTVGAPMVAGGDYEADERRTHSIERLLSGDIKTTSQLAVRFGLSHQDVSTVLVGYSTIAQLEEATACSGHGVLPWSTVSRLQTLWANGFAN